MYINSTWNEYIKLNPEQKLVGYMKDWSSHKCFKCKKFWDEFYKDGDYDRWIHERAFHVGVNYCDVLNFKNHPENIEITTEHMDIWTNDGLHCFRNILVTECSKFEEHEGNEIYYLYLKSDEWKSKRKKALIRDGFRCVYCGTAKNLEVHHITYKNILNEELEDLVTLCDCCHELVHQSDISQNESQMPGNIPPEQRLIIEYILRNNSEELINFIESKIKSDVWLCHELFLLLKYKDYNSWISHLNHDEERNVKIIRESSKHLTIGESTLETCIERVNHSFNYEKIREKDFTDKELQELQQQMKKH